MKLETSLGPANTVIEIGLETGESLTTEAGAMIAMSSGLDVETTTYKKGKGGFLKAAKRLFAGESFFLNHYSARSSSKLFLAPTLTGDIKNLSLSGEKIIVQSGSFLACEGGVDIETGWQGFKSLFSGEGLFWLSASGTGELVFSSFGEIYEVPVDGEYTVDTGHIVAFDDTLKFSLSKAGGSWLHSIIGGEGIVCKFSGQGRLWCQSHNPANFGYALMPHLSPKKR